MNNNSPPNKAGFIEITLPISGSHQEGYSDSYLIPKAFCFSVSLRDWVLDIAPGTSPEQETSLDVCLLRAEVREAGIEGLGSLGRAPPFPQTCYRLRKHRKLRGHLRIRCQRRKDFPDLSSPTGASPTHRPSLTLL